MLVVDDEQSCRDLHEAWLQDEYEVVTAADGQTALAEAPTADVVLLDRELGERSGTEVAERIADRGLDCFVVVVSGLEPDFDIVDLPIDEYLTKPVTGAELVGVVEEMLSRRDTQELMRECYSLASRKATLELEYSAVELGDREEYEELTATLERKRSELRERLAAHGGEWRQAMLWALEETADGAGRRGQL